MVCSKRAQSSGTRLSPHALYRVGADPGRVEDPFAQPRAERPLISPRPYVSRSIPLKDFLMEDTFRDQLAHGVPLLLTAVVVGSALGFAFS